MAAEQPRETGALTETYAAAIQHDLYDGDGTLVGVVRRVGSADETAERWTPRGRPTGWFNALVDENVAVLGPPEPLLDETKQRHEELKLAGMCDEGAHNAAWEEVDFERRYREFLDTDADAQAALDDLLDRLHGGEDIALVCFEGERKRCHRRVLREHILDRL